MDVAIRVRLKELHDKYNPILERWIRKNQSKGHIMYSHFVNLQRSLKGEIPVHDEIMLHSLRNCLEKFFPKEKFFPDVVISLDSSDEGEDVTQKDTLPTTQQFALPTSQNDLPLVLDDLVTPTHDFVSSTSLQAEATPKTSEKTRERGDKPFKRPEKPLGSIAEYKTKTTILRPASAYASNTSNKPKIPFSIPYKSPVQKTTQFDPKSDAIRLSGIKQKIYSNMYLNNNIKKNENLSSNENSAAKESNNAPLNESINSSVGSKKRRSSLDELLKEQPLLTNSKLRKKKKQSYAESSSYDETSGSDTSDEETSEEEEYFSSIPIQKSQSVIARRTRSATKKNKSKQSKQQTRKRILRQR